MDEQKLDNKPNAVSAKLGNKPELDKATAKLSETMTSGPYHRSLQSSDRRSLRSSEVKKVTEQQNIEKLNSLESKTTRQTVTKLKNPKKSRGWWKRG